MKTLNTYGEVLIALGEGKTLTDDTNSEWRLYDDEIKRFGTGTYKIDAIKLPCIVKEEPEYFYEYEWFVPINEVNDKGKVVKTGNFKTECGIILDENKAPNNATKTGRKFIIENGIPIEVK